MKKKILIGLLLGAALFGLSAAAEETESLSTESSSQAAADGTVIYDGNGVTVTVRPDEAGTSVVYETVNQSGSPVLICPGQLIVNDITVESYGYTEDNISSGLWYLSYAGSAEDLEVNTDLIYVENGASDTFTRSCESTLSFFGCESIEQLKAAVGVIGLNEELAFDGEDQDRVYDTETYELKSAFIGIGELTEAEIPDSSWDGTWEEPEGTVLYEDERLKVIDLGIAEGSYGAAWFSLIVENHTDGTITSYTSYDTESVLNDGETYATMWGDVLPGTRGAVTLSMSFPDETESESEPSVTNAYAMMEFWDYTTYETLAEIEYFYGKNVDQDALRAKSAELKVIAESEAAEQAAEYAQSEKAESVSLADFTIEAQTIFDNGDFVITATAVGMSPYQEDSLQLYLTFTNNTETDAHISFAYVDPDRYDGTYAYVNGYQIEANAYTDVAAGETTEDYVFLSLSALKEAGIENVGEIELKLTIEDQEYNELAVMEPAVIRTSAYDEMDTQLGEDMHEICNENGLTLAAKYVAETEDTAAHLVFAIGNQTETTPELKVDNLKINGILNEDFYYYEAEQSGRTVIRSYNLINAWSDEDFLEANGIEEITSLSVTFYASSDGAVLLETADLEIPLS